jgi:hypothetical protein
MIQKYLILVDEQSQNVNLEHIKTTLKNDGIELLFKELNPSSYLKRENGEQIFDYEKFENELNSLPYFKQLDSIVCDYNLITDIINGFQIIKTIKSINPNYKKQIILYSAKIDSVIEDIITKGDFEAQKDNLKSLIHCNIEFVRRDSYNQEVIKHIKKEKPFNFEDELIKWFYDNKDDEFNCLFPKYKGKKFGEIAKYLESNTNDSVEFKKELVEQVIAYLSTINGLNGG